MKFLYEVFELFAFHFHEIRRTIRAECYDQARKKKNHRPVDINRMRKFRINEWHEEISDLFFHI